MVYYQPQPYYAVYPQYYPAYPPPGYFPYPTRPGPSDFFLHPGGFFVLFILGMLLATAIILPFAVYYILTSALAGASVESIVTPWFLLAFVTAQDVVLVGLAYYIVVQRGLLAHAGAGLRMPEARGWAEGLGLGLAVAGVGFLYSWGLEGLGFQGESPLATFHGPSALLPLMAATVLVAPLAEEYFFRGIGYFGIMKYYAARSNPSGPMYALIASSLVFAVAHLSLTGMPFYILVGMLLAVLARRTSSLGPPVVAHAVNNFVATYMAVMGGW